MPSCPSCGRDVPEQRDEPDAAGVRRRIYAFHYTRADKGARCEMTHKPVAAATTSSAPIVPKSDAAAAPRELDEDLSHDELTHVERRKVKKKRTLAKISSVSAQARIDDGSDIPARPRPRGVPKTALERRARLGDQVVVAMGHMGIVARGHALSILTGDRRGAIVVRLESGAHGTYGLDDTWVVKEASGAPPCNDCDEYGTVALCADDRWRDPSCARAWLQREGLPNRSIAELKKILAERGRAAPTIARVPKSKAAAAELVHHAAAPLARLQVWDALNRVHASLDGGTTSLCGWSLPVNRRRASTKDASSDLACTFCSDAIVKLLPIGSVDDFVSAARDAGWFPGAIRSACARVRGVDDVELEISAAVYGSSPGSRRGPATSTRSSTCTTRTTTTSSSRPRKAGRPKTACFVCGGDRPADLRVRVPNDYIIDKWPQLQEKIGERIPTCPSCANTLQPHGQFERRSDAQRRRRALEATRRRAPPRVCVQHDRAARGARRGRGGVSGQARSRSSATSSTSRSTSTLRRGRCPRCKQIRALVNSGTSCRSCVAAASVKPVMKKKRSRRSRDED